MTRTKSGRLYGILAIIVLIFSTSFFFIPVFIIGLLKLFPNMTWRAKCTRQIDNIIHYWVDVNNIYINCTQKVHWIVPPLDHLDPKKWYIMIANHQTWLDIVLLQRLFNRKIPMLKFFIKDSLKWVPLLGFAWWAMGSPFMKRYSKDYLVKYPQKKGQDLLATHKAMSLFKYIPSTIINFVEGTRFTAEKKSFQNSPYQYLLKPKAGGISFAISALNEKVQSLLDVTIVYKDAYPTLWNFLCRRLQPITIHVREIAIPSEFKTEKLINSPSIQEAFRQWLNEQWLDKDKLIAATLGQC